MVSVFDKIKKGISKTKSQVFDRVTYAIKAKKRIDDELLEDIEEILISGDVGVETTLHIIDEVKRRVKKERYEDSDDLLKILKEEVAAVFPESKFQRSNLLPNPYIILVVGVNGTGKTTSIAKLANRFQQEGKRVLLAAADTFRAAAIEQLQEWANRINVEIIKHQSGSDPGAVVFDALQAAHSRQAEVIIIDTAGRLHTKVNLMEELKKIRRVIQKVFPDAPHLSLLVIDATTGQNAVNQARQFIDSVEVNGIVLTKLDGTAKGGAIIGIAHQLNLPVEYVGVGETLNFMQKDYSQGNKLKSINPNYEYI
jgi:fused signal recognition particle receptor